MRKAFLTALLAGGLAACGGTSAPQGHDGGGGTTGSINGGGCTIDPNCPGNEICVAGHCQGPGGSTTSSSSSSGGTNSSSTSSASSSSSGSTVVDAGPPISCMEAFDAGAGPFTYDGGTLAGAFTARDLQDPASPNYGTVHYSDGGGPRVTLYGEVATTQKALISKGSYSCTYGAWVSDRDGGPYSGILAIAYGLAVDGGCTDDGIIPDNLQPGDVLKLTGYPKEFCLDPNTFRPTYPCPGDTAVTEVKLISGGVTNLGTAPRVWPTVVDPSLIGSGPADAGYQNAVYDGVLLQVRRRDGQKMTVTNDNPDRPNYYGNWVLENHLWASHLFRYYTEPVLGTRYQCVTGVYYYKDGNWKVEPRTDRDLATEP